MSKLETRLSSLRKEVRDAKNVKDTCPTCGRTSINLIELANQVEKLVEKYSSLNLKIAVMGCAVNGPGEAREADLGIAGGIGEGLLFKKGQILRKVPEKELLNALEEEIKTML